MFPKIILSLLFVSCLGLQAQSFRPIQVRDSDNPARQPFAFVADLSSHGFATASFTVAAQKRLIIEELDANGLNVSATGTFIVSVVTNGIKLDHYVVLNAPSNNGYEALFHQQDRYYADPGSTITVTQLSVYADVVKLQISGYQIDLP